MRLRRSPFTLLAILVLCITSLTSIGPATAQSSGSSSDNSPLQMLQGLSPDQRDAIMNQLGIGSGSSSSGGLGGLGGGSGTGGLGGLGGVGTQTMPGRQRPTEEMEEQEADQRTREQQQRQFDEERELLSPFFKGDDWLIITIDAYPPPPAQISQNLQQQLQSGGAGAMQGVQGAGIPGLTPGAATGAIPGALLGGAGAVAAGGGAAGPAPAGGVDQTNPNGAPSGASGTGGEVKPELSEEDKKTRDDLIDLIRSKNPYQLTGDGMLLLPGFAPMPLGGLTEQLAVLRMGVEPVAAATSSSR